MKITQNQLATLGTVASAAGGRVVTDFIAKGMGSGSCIAIELRSPRDVWNAAELIAETDPRLARSLRGPAVESAGYRVILFWPGVTVDT